MRLGILPAAGEADRWGGYPKELLPLSNAHTFLSRAVDLLRSCGCDHVLVITNPAKIHLHAYHLKDWKNVVSAGSFGESIPLREFPGSGLHQRLIAEPGVFRSTTGASRRTA